MSGAMRVGIFAAIGGAIGFGVFFFVWGGFTLDHLTTNLESVADGVWLALFTLFTGFGAVLGGLIGIGANQESEEKE